MSANRVVFLLSLFAFPFVPYAGAEDEERIAEILRTVREQRKAEEVGLRPLEEVIPLAVKGEKPAQAELGRRYLNGYSAPRDVDKAYYWYLKAARQGDAESAFWVGHFTEGGTDLSADDRSKQALEWYRRAAEGCSASAQFHLGAVYRDGRSYFRNGITVPVDLDLALHWLEKAARNKSGGAMCELGVTLALGKGGVPKDAVTGLAWFYASREFGTGKAYDKQFEMIEQSLTPEQVAAAKVRGKILAEEVRAAVCKPAL